MHEAEASPRTYRNSTAGPNSDHRLATDLPKTTKSSLRAIAGGVYVWSPQPSNGWGLANCGLIVSPVGKKAAWIDTPFDRHLANDFLTRCQPLLPAGVAISRAIITHGNGDHHWGAEVIPDAEVISTSETRNDFTPSSTVVATLSWTGTSARPSGPSTGPALTSGPVHAIGLPPAHTHGDLIVQLPDQGVVLAGDLIFGSTPAAPGDAPVPGHGPVLDRSGVLAHIKYLDYLRCRAQELHAAGIPALDAAWQIIREDRYPGLGLRERLAVTIGSEYRDLGHATESPDMIGEVTAMAQIAWELAHPSIPGPRAASGVLRR